MSKIFFTSDTHGYHKNITKGESSWPEGSATRDFNTVQEMNECILDGINSLVDENDVLYHLGDFTFAGIDKIWTFRKQIKCKNIHLILGNHDAHIRNNKVIKVDDIVQGRAAYDEIRTQDLFTSVQDVLTVKFPGKVFFLSHYAHRVWENSHKNWYHLYAHSHGSLEHEPWGKSMDVGVDNSYRLFGKYRPFAAEEVIEILDKRQLNIIDHHKPENPS